jgi:glycerol-3-phosphate O-acyltransferase/dihydroxyacetone phosphate acyltransferase
VVKSTPTLQNAIQQLSSPNGVSYKVAPHLDQTKVYDAVFDKLRKDGCIFPEGGSHDRPDMLPLQGSLSHSGLKYTLLIGL